jgi:hypothetical protein
MTGRASRTGRIGRVTRVTLAAAIVVAAVAGAATSVPAGAQGTNGPGDCSDHVEVLLLIDQSASLRTTDPDNQRVTAAQVLLRSLASSAASAGGTVGVTIAGFGSEISEVGRAVLPGERDAATDLVTAFSDRASDANTDYVLALDQAVEHFSRFRDLPTECKRLVWFTDGAYSIDDPTTIGVVGYTLSFAPSAIEAELMGQVCGPLPPTSRLDAPLSQQIRDAGFTIQMVDLRTGGGGSADAERARANTTPVIDRLLGGEPSDPCRVAGTRVEAGQASALAAEFFAQGQLALGRREVACSDLQAGVPAAMVRAATARASSPDDTVSILIGGQTLVQGDGFASYSADQGRSLDAGAITASSSGELVGCYLDLAAEVVPLGQATAVAGSLSSNVRIDVRGAAGGSAALGPPLGPDAVGLTATVAGAPMAVEWLPEANVWQVTLTDVGTTPPVLDLTVTRNGFGVISSSSLTVALVDTPPLPRVVWDGPRTMEGAGSFTGRVTVVPGASIGGTLCVTFGTAVTSLADAQVALDRPQICAPDRQTFSLAATVTVGESGNRELTIDLPFTSTSQAPGVATPVAIDQSGTVAFGVLSLTKPADALVSALITLVVVLVSTLVPLIVLLFLLNHERRLPTPRGRRVGVVRLHARAGELHIDPDTLLRGSDLEPIRGNRRRYDLPLGLTVRASRTLNPFAALTVQVVSERGPVTAVPWMAAGPGRTVEVPAAFQFLVLLRNEPGTDVGEAVVVVPPDAGPIEALDAVEDALAATNLTWSRVHEALNAGVTI